MRHILLPFFLIIAAAAPAQTTKSPNATVTVVFYNVENLFDIINDTSPGDDEYTPGSPKLWDKTRYEKKLKDIGGTLGSINEAELPALIGLAEVENKKVLEDLIKEPALKKGKYEIIHFDSPDERGIDAALLVKPDEFKVTGSRAIPVTFSFSPADKTRDILYVSGTMDDGKTYHIYVNHWPSRSGDAIQSEMRRMTAAAALRRDIDNILRTDAEARVIIMGDFNDEPTNRSLMQILNATNKRTNTTTADLYNLMYDKHNIDDIGTLAYNGQWDMFDQIIVSWPMMKKSDGYYTGFEGGSVFMPDNLLFTNPENGFRSPNRTFGGDEYFGGVSDHLPVFLVLKKDETVK